MIDAPLALAFTSGLVAAVNPCGFAMLPAYISFFLGHEREHEPSRTESVVRVIPVALAVSAGFVVVFGVIGVILRSASSTIQEHAPWATMVIGVALVALGIAALAGKNLTARIPKLNRGGGSSGLWSMFLYGVSYAVASLTCTLGIFIVNVVAAFTRTDFISGVAILLAYAAGMSVVLLTLTVALALTRDSVVDRLRSSMQYVDRAAAVLMVAMGAYVTWYGIFALRVRDDPRAEPGPAEWFEDWSADITSWVDRVGATRVGLLLVAATGVMITVSVLLTRSRGDSPGDREDDNDASRSARPHAETPSG